ncbi:hypothetical protein SERLADRAFT_407589 [Serpula lacrymans var. lacrymans S7.9]|uniref:DDE-1 domain-containing protein n=1 Tax=Serpula lacrymans var. lacrymans (strain S7.9) TaxID=578457 RepID=F8NST3_SERL9|nr:uncharacterized protein SERLADRAFT_407589 [Serpula lacrymans var. lacrymans S7.9]EGO27007.1 hypothetical protein SERLADRAFT_407589 [Serpula lacrymans var. lacrymans S7.9]
MAHIVHWEIKETSLFWLEDTSATCFWYRNNKTAWMTAEYFEEWIKHYDTWFREKNQKVCLWLDNFAGHNNAGEDDIYNINLLEVMLMANEAWVAVSTETIRNCWHHAFELKGPPTPSALKSGTSDAGAWKIVKGYVDATIATMPVAIRALQEHLGTRYNEADWKPTFDAIFPAEDDTTTAVIALNNLTEKATTYMQPIPCSIISTSQSNKCSIPKLEIAESKLMQSIDELHQRKRIWGTRLTIEELLNPIEEMEIVESPYRFLGGDEEIIAAARAAVVAAEDGVAVGESPTATSSPIWSV